METEVRTRRGRSQVLSTSGAVFLTIFGRLLLYKWSPELFDSNDFALYVIGLRGLSLGSVALAPALVAGLSYWVARSVENHKDQDGAYLWAAHLLIFILFTPVLLAASLAPDACARLALGNDAASHIVLPLALCLLGQYGVLAPLAFKLGKTEILKANLMTVLSAFVIPVFCLFLYDDSAQDVFWAMANWTLLLSLLLNVSVLLRGIDRHASSFQEFRRHSTRLYNYTLPRLPASAGVSLILALPVVIPAHQSKELAVGAIFAAGGVLLNAASAVISPLSLVILPHAAQMLAQDRHAEVLKKSKLLLKALAAAGLMATAIAVFLAPRILEAWLGPEAAAYGYFWIGLTPAMLPIMLHKAFSSVLNAASPRPFDSWNVCLSLLTFVGLYLVTEQFSWEFRTLGAFNGCLYVLAFLTVQRTWLLLSAPEVRS